MKMTVLKIDVRPSKYGGNFWYVFLKTDAGQSFRTCIYPNFGNYRRCGWDKVIQMGVGTILDYAQLPINQKGLWDADKAFKILMRITMIG